eukprot:TRINITY_DN13421_c0_g1_i1.p1 TRINITY_DN13421_c0_g1~~TRINITY_DN13421_c0_g1_i1.p1  ORF type:complete len:340 (-),score=65.28 TRINITY_DN13421_c0_g1_i1:174-1193(-)
MHLTFFQGCAALFVLLSTCTATHQATILQDARKDGYKKDSERKSLIRHEADAREERAISRMLPRRRVYVDFGANWANTLRLYRDIADKAEADSGPWEVYAFEASPLIVPYLSKFVGFLNGDNPKPPLEIPPAGSTDHLSKYAPQFGCGGFKEEAMRECMFQKFQKPLSQMKADKSLMTDEVIREHLAMARTPPSQKDRYVLIPAAAGSTDSTMHLGKVDAEQMIRGGALDNDSEGEQTDVPLVDVVSWLISNFSEDDYIVVKVDIEGGEFPILNALIDKGKTSLIDRIALECHSSAGNCGDLLARFKVASKIAPLIEGKDYVGWDSFSSPDKYVPLNPA